MTYFDSSITFKKKILSQEAPFYILTKIDRVTVEIWPDR
jgi:hypothetical protein